MTGTDIDREVLLDIAVDGIDWSCRGFWAEIDRFPSAAMFDDYEARLKAERLPDDEVLFRLRDDEDGEAEAEKRPWVDITLGSLLSSTQRALDEYRHLFGYTVRDGTIIEVDYDAVGADVVLQFATLKEVVYG